MNEPRAVEFHGTERFELLRLPGKGENRPMPPTIANGKICYAEMPAIDIARSSEFYQQVFGWNVRARGTGTSPSTTA